MNCSKPVRAPGPPGRSTEDRRAWSSVETRSTRLTTEPLQPESPWTARRAWPQAHPSDLHREPHARGCGQWSALQVTFLSNRTVLGQVRPRSDCLMAMLVRVQRYSHNRRSPDLLQTFAKLKEEKLALAPIQSPNILSALLPIRGSRPMPHLQSKLQGAMAPLLQVFIRGCDLPN